MKKNFKVIIISLLFFCAFGIYIMSDNSQSAIAKNRRAIYRAQVKTSATLDSLTLVLQSKLDLIANDSAIFRTLSTDLSGSTLDSILSRHLDNRYIAEILIIDKNCNTLGKASTVALASLDCKNSSQLINKKPNFQFNKEPILNMSVDISSFKIVLRTDLMHLFKGALEKILDIKKLQFVANSALKPHDQAIKKFKMDHFNYTLVYVNHNSLISKTKLSEEKLYRFLEYARRISVFSLLIFFVLLGYHLLIYRVRELKKLQSTILELNRILHVKNTEDAKTNDDFPGQVQNNLEKSIAAKFQKLESKNLKLSEQYEALRKKHILLEKEYDTTFVRELDQKILAKYRYAFELRVKNQIDNLNLLIRDIDSSGIKPAQKLNQLSNFITEGIEHSSEIMVFSKSRGRICNLN